MEGYSEAGLNTAEVEVVREAKKALDEELKMIYGIK
jgi:hypothetical protein